MNSTLASLTLAAAILSPLAAEPIDSLRTDLTQQWVNAISTFDEENTRVSVVIAREQTSFTLNDVVKVRSEGRMLILEYRAEKDGKTYRAAVDSLDVLMVQEAPR